MKTLFVLGAIFTSLIAMSCSNQESLDGMLTESQSLSAPHRYGINYSIMKTLFVLGAIFTSLIAMSCSNQESLDGMLTESQSLSAPHRYGIPCNSNVITKDDAASMVFLVTLML